MGVSLRAYARHRGCSLTAVQKAIRGGRITPEPDGTIDPGKADAEWSANTGAARGRKTRRVTKVKAVPNAAVNAVRETLRESGIPLLQCYLLGRPRPLKEVQADGIPTPRLNTFCCAASSAAARFVIRPNGERERNGRP